MTDNSAKLTFVDTNSLPRVKTPEGEVTEVLNNALQGAKNVLGTLRWLKSGEHFTAQPGNRHQLIYLMEGSGTIRLDNKDYDVPRGAGVYLGPSETATIKASGSDTVKLFHLVVPKIPR
jgi:AraC-like ligand binding domain